MLNIRIDKSELDYLLKSGLDQNLIESIKTSYNQQFDNISLKISKTIGEKILDYLGNELARKGFRQNHEPNSFGIMIENIIDKFSREIYE